MRQTIMFLSRWMHHGMRSGYGRRSSTELCKAPGVTIYSKLYSGRRTSAWGRSRHSPSITNLIDPATSALESTFCAEPLLGILYVFSNIRPCDRHTHSQLRRLRLQHSQEGTCMSITSHGVFTRHRLPFVTRNCDETPPVFLPGTC